MRRLAYRLEKVDLHRSFGDAEVTMIHAASIGTTPGRADVSGRMTFCDASCVMVAGISTRDEGAST